MALVLKEVVDRVGVLTLNNPAKHNVLSINMLQELIDGLEEMQKAKIPVVVIRALKDAKVWSAGFDIRELPTTKRDPLGFDNPLEQMLRAVETYPGPVIAMVQGGVWGGACDLTITCDMVFGDPSCTFAITPVKIGLPYTASGILHFINRLNMNHAKEMFFTAEPVEAERALEWGILNHLKSAEALESFTMEFANRITKHSAMAISVVKEQFRVISNAHPLSPHGFERIQGMRRRVYDSADYTEGIKAFLEKRPPVFRGE